ncbi:hypothetical protein WB44_09050 [Synechococcus sp. WH 8020]|nr:hypothetical protein WB44_09050 [Synechococcus sp. WH 8020]
MAIAKVVNPLAPDPLTKIRNYSSPPNPDPSLPGAVDDITGVGAAPDPLTKIRHYTSPPNPDPSMPGAVDDLTGVGAAPDPLTKIAHYTSPPQPDPSRPGGIEDLMLVTGADAVITYEPMPEMLAGYGTTVTMAGEPMDDSQPGIDDLANDAYFPRYGAAVCYSSSSSRRTGR